MPYYKFEGHRRSLLAFNQTAEQKDNKFVESADPNATQPDGGPKHGTRKMMWMRFNRSSMDNLPALSENGPCLTFIPPFSSSMPDTKESAIRVRQPGRVAPSAQAQPENIVMTHQGNDKYYLFLGMIIGLIVPLVLKDVTEIVRRLVKM